MFFFEIFLMQIIYQLWKLNYIYGRKYFLAQPLILVDSPKIIGKFIILKEKKTFNVILKWTNDKL